MFFIGQGGSEKIVAATFADFQTAAQVIDAEREVANRQIGLADSRQQRFEVFLAKVR